MFFVFCTVRNFYLRHENFWSKHVPTCQKTLFISSKHWRKKFRKKKWKVKSCKPKKSKNRNFTCFFVFCTVRNFYLRHENFWNKHVPTCQKTLFISSKHWIKKFRKKKWKVKSCKPKKSKSLNFSCLFVFFTVRNIYLRRENFWNKHVPTCHKTLFISSKHWIKKFRKKNEKWKVVNQKSRKIVTFSCFLCFVRYEIFT